MELRSAGVDNSTVPVQSVALRDGALRVGTQWALWSSLDPQQSAFVFDRVPGVIDLGGPSALAFDAAGNVWIGTAECVSVQAPETLSLLRVCGVQGLPVGNVTRIAASPQTVCLGTRRGLVLRSSSDGSFGYFSGPRFLAAASARDADSAVTAVAVCQLTGRVAAATSGGVAVLQAAADSLGEKAERLERVMARHRQTSAVPLPGGAFLAGDVALVQFGNTENVSEISNDNNGLWTSVYLLSQCFRYSATKDPAVKQAGNTCFQFHLLPFVSRLASLRQRGTI